MEKNRLKQAARLVQRQIDFAFEYDFYDITDYIEFVPDYIREMINNLLKGDKAQLLEYLEQFDNEPAETLYTDISNF